MRETLENAVAGLLAAILMLFLAVWFVVCIPFALPFWIWDAVRGLKR